jgi:excisionase family DNA binding protein
MHDCTPIGGLTAKYFPWLQLAAWGKAMDGRLFSIEDAAKYLGGISKYTIHSWLSSGRLRRSKVGSRTMVRESELERVILDGGKSPGRPRKEASAPTAQSTGRVQR